jgi:hypothetical protein
MFNIMDIVEEVLTTASAANYTGQRLTLQNWNFIENILLLAQANLVSLF